MVGLNSVIQILRKTSNIDDDIGGANNTGTAVYSDVPARIEDVAPLAESLAQGLEAVKVVQVAFRNTGQDVWEQDIVLVTSHSDSPHYNEFLKVLKVQRDSLRRVTGKAHIELYCERIEKSRNVFS